MSVTTLQNPAVYSIARTLTDYELHHSESPAPSSAATAPNAHPLAANARTSHPADWESQYRRVPPHRPINRELDFQFRNTTRNRIETFFLFNMFGGIQMVQRLNRAWRETGGKINPTYFRWPIGGEY